MAVGLAAGLLAGCNAPPGQDPQVLYQSIYADFVHGDLGQAAARAHQARLQAAADTRVDPAWSLKFRLLEADALLKQGRWQDVILLLGAGSFPAAGDLAIRRNLLLGGAEYNLDRIHDAESHRREARRLAESGRSALIGDVLRSEALVERDAGRWDAALDKLDASLRVARRGGDRWLETLDLVSIGFIHLKTEHYDRAAVVLQQAAAAAQSLHSRTQAPLALGNLGWAYLSLGDFDAALVNFREAERQSRDTGNVEWQVRWLQDAGLAAFKVGNLKEAQQYDEQALAAASTLPASEETDDLANIESNLALLLLQQHAVAAAGLHADRAADSARGSKDVNVAAYATFMQGLVAARESRGGDAARLYLRAHGSTTDLEIRMSVENALAKLYREGRRAGEAESWFRRSIRTFEERRATVQDEAMRLPAFAFGDAIYRDYAEYLLEAGRSGEALRTLDRGRARTLEEGLGVPGSEAAVSRGARTEVQALAAKLDARILFYSLGADKSHLWVVAADATRVFDLPGEAQIRAQVGQYQREIQKSGDPLHSGFAAARGLHRPWSRPPPACCRRARESISFRTAFCMA